MSSKHTKPNTAPYKQSPPSRTASTPPSSRHTRHNSASTITASSTTPAPPPVFLTLSPSSFTSLTLTHHNFFHVSVGRIHGRLMALPVVLDCHSSLLAGGGGGGSGSGSGGGGVVVSGSAVLGRLFAHLPSLIADVNVAKVKAVKDKPALLETDKILFTYQFRETHSKYHIMTVVPPHSSQPRHHYADIDSEADISSDDLRDPDDDNDADSEDDNNTKQHDDEENEEGGWYKGGRYRAFQVSKHSLYVRAIARYRGEGAEDETRREGKEEKAQEKEEEEVEEAQQHGEDRVVDRASGRSEKVVIAEVEEEEEDTEGGWKKKRRKREEKSKTDKKSGGRRRSVTVLDDENDDDFV